MKKKNASQNSPMKITLKIKDKKSLLELLQSIERVSVLAEENPFKVRAYQKALSLLEECEDLVERIENQTLTELSGIGKGINDLLTEYATTGTSSLLTELKAKIPKGLEEFSKIPGIGPKKARSLIDELQIHSLTELHYACKENRLLTLKGFGQKVQDQVLKGIEFLQSTSNFIRIDQALSLSKTFIEELTQSIAHVQSLSFSETGPLRRRLETLDHLDFVFATDDKKLIQKIQKFTANFTQEKKSLPILLHFCAENEFEATLFWTTGTAEHFKGLGIEKNKTIQTLSEKEIYQKFSMPLIPPTMRESGDVFSLLKNKKLSESILGFQKVRGIFHNHTTYSDGSHSCEEMVKAAIHLGYEYIGISDHSQSAFYAQGLKPDILKKQEKEIRALQEKYPEIKIFWGVESDILADGSLDYDEKTLKGFDFVVASIHSRFQMNEETMTQRILAALRNPYTSFLGHPTGRLLLGRPGYTIDMNRILLTAKECNVAVEINANPYRLDLDWRFGPLLRKYNTLVSIHPDAHEIDGLRDTEFGITVAQKALLPKELILNTLGPKEVENWLQERNS